MTFPLSTVIEAMCLRKNSPTSKSSHLSNFQAPLIATTSDTIMDIAHVVCTAVRDTIANPGLGNILVENHLRGLLMSSLCRGPSGHLLYPVVEDRLDTTRPDTATPIAKYRDISIAPLTTPEQPLAVGELKSWCPGGRVAKRGFCTLQFIGSRLSDLHYLQHLARQTHTPAFFLDVTMDLRTINWNAYRLLKEAQTLIEDRRQFTSDESLLMETKGARSYFKHAVDKTRRGTCRRSFRHHLYPFLELPHHGVERRGPVFVRCDKPTKGNGRGLLSLGINVGGRPAMKSSYRLVPTMSNAAFLFALFDDHGLLIRNTDDILKEMGR